MGFLSKRKAKKEAKKAEESAVQAATDGAAAAQAVSAKELSAAAKVPGEIKIQHHDGPQSGTKKKSCGAAPLSSSGKVISLRKRLRENVSTKRPMIRRRPPLSPGGQSHVSAITRDTAFPETPKRRLFPPPTSNLLPDDDYDCIDEDDAVVGGVVIAGGWAGGA